MKLRSRGYHEKEQVTIALPFQPLVVRNHLKPLLSTFLESKLPKLSQDATASHSPELSNKGLQLQPAFQGLERSRMKRNRLLILQNWEQTKGRRLSLEPPLISKQNSKSPKRLQRSEKKTVCVPILKYPVFLPRNQNHEKLSKDKEEVKKEQKIKQILKKIHFVSFSDQLVEREGQQHRMSMEITRIQTDVEDSPAPRIKLGKGKSNHIKELLKNSRRRVEKRSPKRERVPQVKKTMPSLIKAANPWQIGPWNGEQSGAQSGLSS